MPKNLKRGHLGSINVFRYRKLQKNARGEKCNPVIEFDNFRKKSHSAKKTQRGTLWSRPYFWKHKKCGLVRESNPRSPASQEIS